MTSTVSASTFAGIRVLNTQHIINEYTMLNALVYSPPKRGKTWMAESLNRMTKRFYGKPTLIIANESADGGGTMSLTGKDTEVIVPKTIDEFEKIVAELFRDTHYGGVAFDSATEHVKAFVQPYALALPDVRKEDPLRRAAGVPTRSDYQTMGEKLRQQLNRLMQITRVGDPITDSNSLKYRKHLFVTALEQEKYEDDGKTLVAIQPALPGAMAQTSTAMFNTVGQLVIRNHQEKVDGRVKNTATRWYVTAADGVRVRGDRTNMLPAECEPDWEVIWEKYWMPKLEESKK